MGCSTELFSRIPTSRKRFRKIHGTRRAAGGCPEVAGLDVFSGSRRRSFSSLIRCPRARASLRSPWLDGTVLDRSSFPSQLRAVQDYQGDVPLGNLGQISCEDKPCVSCEVFRASDSSSTSCSGAYPDGPRSFHRWGIDL